MQSYLNVDPARVRLWAPENVGFCLEFIRTRALAFPSADQVWAWAVPCALCSIPICCNAGPVLAAKAFVKTG